MATDQASGRVQPALSRMGFNGQLRERPRGWYHLGHGHRIYSPLLMRFHCPDRLSPFGAGGLNAYAYCLGDPVNQQDPTGRSTELHHQASLAIAGLSITYGLLAFLIPPLARRAPVGSPMQRWASMSPSLSSPLGGLDAAATLVGMVGGAIGGITTVLNIQDPESAVTKDLSLISMYFTIAALVTGRLVVGFTPAKDFSSPKWRNLARFVHGRKKIESGEQRMPSDFPMSRIAPGRQMPPPSSQPAEVMLQSSRTQNRGGNPGRTIRLGPLDGDGR